MQKRTGSQARSRVLARLRPSPAMTVALLALFTALGGVAGAALVGSDRTVSVCISTKDGTMKVLDTAVSTTCPGGQVKARLAGVDDLGRVNDSNKLEGNSLAQVRSGIDADKLDGLDSSAAQRRLAAARAPQRGRVVLRA